MKVSYSRLFSTGSFEHMKIGLETECEEAQLGETFQKLVASAIALKENGLEIEHKYIYEENARKRIAELKNELSGLQGTLPSPEEEQ